MIIACVADNGARNIAIKRLSEYKSFKIIKK